MKKLLAIIITLTMMLSAIPVTAEGIVEISFCVGEETLLINGESVTVEKPYVVGEGVTLVPLRVITEAFGAKVKWIGETKTVNLEYPDVNIVLQIDNPIAEVNGKAEELLSAPELTNGFTMVPLRFISETFGADVGYDEITKRITVKKTKSDAGTTVKVGVTSAYIGDSYYGWMMENPSDLSMEYRQFDGAYTEFVHDDDNYFYIDIYAVPKDYDVEEDFTASKEKLQGYTLVKADKTKENGITKIHLQARDKKYFFNAIRFITDKYVFDVTGSFENEKADIKNELVRLMSTFSVSYNEQDTYDLSTVKDGFRRFEAEALKLSVDIPADHILISDEYAETNFVFSSIDSNVSTIHLVAYSKSSVTGAKELAETDYSHNKKLFNEGITQFTDIAQREYSQFQAYEYTFEINSTKNKEFAKDVFFEKGDYVYNIRISVPSTMSNRNEHIAKILNSIDVTAPDSNVLGEILRNTIEEKEGSTEETFGKANVNIPNKFRLVSESESGKTYINPTNSMILSVNTGLRDQSGKTNVKAALHKYERELAQTKGTTIEKEVTTLALGRNSVTFMIWKTAGEEDVLYHEMYTLEKDTWVYYITISCPELAYSDSVRTEIRSIISSVYIQ